MIRRLDQVLLISFSAFFADLGYQVAVALFSIYLVYLLGAPVWLYGLAEGLNYGLGSLFGYVGGKLSDMYGAKAVSVVGNALIPLMSFFVLTSDPVVAMVLFSLGWWMRNLRTPSRRALLSAVTSEEERQEAYGILHALDIAGATIAVGYITLVLYLGLDLRVIMLTTVAFLAVSTVLLALVRVERPPEEARGIRTSRPPGAGGLMLAILAATSLFGFSYFSFGYPILTITERFNAPYLGTLSYLVFLIASALSGYAFGRARGNEVGYLAAGYATSAAASLGFQLSPDLASFLASSALMGVAVGAVETLEPTIVSKIYPREGEGMGLLSASRSLGLFTGNMAMGLLYGAGLAYWYSFAVSAASTAIMMPWARARSSGRPRALPGP